MPSGRHEPKNIRIFYVSRVLSRTVRDVKINYNHSGTLLRRQTETPRDDHTAARRRSQQTVVNFVKNVRRILAINISRIVHIIQTQ